MASGKQQLKWALEKYWSLRSEFDQEQRKWAAEYKDSCVAEALHRRDLESKDEQLLKVSEELASARSRIHELQNEQVAWSAAVGRRDGQIATAESSQHDGRWRYTFVRPPPSDRASNNVW